MDKRTKIPLLATLLSISLAFPGGRDINNSKKIYSSNGTKFQIEYQNKNNKLSIVKEERKGILCDVEKRILEKTYYSYFDNYNVEYLQPKYLVSDEELEKIKEIMDSLQECTYTFTGTEDDMMDMISKNTDEYIQNHPESNYINATNTMYVNDLSPDDKSISNYYRVLRCTESALRNEILKLINGELSNNANEDLCRLKDLVMVIDQTVLPYNEKNHSLALAEYNPEDNMIVIYLNSFLPNYDYDMGNYKNFDISDSDQISLEKLDALERCVIHEIDHLRQIICDDRVEKGQINKDISYDSNVITTLIESSAESAVYDEQGAVFDYKTSYEDSDTYYTERDFENKLLLMSLTDNTTTLDDYYASIFDSDLNSLVHYFNLKTDNDLKAFFNILKQYDALNFRNPIAFEITGTVLEEGMSIAQARTAIGCNYEIDILRLSLRNLIEYNINNKNELSAEEMLTLEKLIMYQICDSSYTYELDENWNPILNKDGLMIQKYDKSFVEQVLELEENFHTYIKEFYCISDEELNTLSDNSEDNVFNMYMNAIQQTSSFYNSKSISKLLDKFPKLKIIVPKINDVMGESYKKVLKSSR